MSRGTAPATCVGAELPIWSLPSPIPQAFGMHGAAELRESETMAEGARKPADAGRIAGERLKSFIERIERLEEEKAALGGDIKEVYSEAKGVGFDTKIMRQLVRLRRMDSADRREQEELLDLYKRAIGLE